MPESPRTRHVQQHPKPVGHSFKQPGAGLARLPMKRKAAKAIARKDHQLRLTTANGELIDATCSGCSWSRWQLTKQKAQQAHDLHVGQETDAIRWRRPR